MIAWNSLISTLEWHCSREMGTRVQIFMSRSGPPNPDNIMIAFHVYNPIPYYNKPTLGKTTAIFLCTTESYIERQNVGSWIKETADSLKQHLIPKTALDYILEDLGDN